MTLHTKMLCSAMLLASAPLTGCIIIDEDRSDWTVETRALEEPIRRLQASGSADVTIIHCACSNRVEILAPEGEHHGASLITAGGSLIISGGDDMELRVYTSELSQITLSGSSEIRVKQLNRDALTITSSGSSDVELDGRVELLSLRLSGSADIDASRLRARRVSVVSSGSSDVSVCAIESLDVTSSGSSDVVYHCDPDHISAHTSGSGEVSGR